MMKKLSFLILSLFLVENTWASGSQYLAGDDEIKSIKKVETGDYKVENDAFFGGANLDKTFDKKSNNAKSYHLSHPRPELKDFVDHNNISVDQELPGTFKKNQDYNEYRYADILKKTQGMSNYAFSFSYIGNNYIYDNDGGSFNNIFRQGRDSGSHEGGGVLISFDKYFFKKIFNFAWGLNFGAGFSSGKATFGDGKTSQTTIKLWSLPLDLSLTMELPLWNFAKISLSGGPSLLGLIQTRDDREDEDDEKVKRQLGKGFFGAAKLKINLSNFSEKNSMNLFTDWAITKMYLNLESRYQNYSKFADGLTVSGASFGIGFTFEFI